MSAIIEPGTRVAIHPTKEGNCADVGRVLIHNKHDNSYTVKIERQGVGWRDIPADKVEVIK